MVLLPLRTAGCIKYWYFCGNCAIPSLPVRPDGTGGSSREAPEGQGRRPQSRSARDGCAGSTALTLGFKGPAPLCGVTARIPTSARPLLCVSSRYIYPFSDTAGRSMVAENARRAAACAADWGAPPYSSAYRVTFGCRVSLLGFGAKSLLGRYSAGRFLPVSTGFPFACARWCGWWF